MKVKSRFVITEAMQYTGDNWREVGEWMGSSGFRSFTANEKEVAFSTSMGTVIAREFDYIVRNYEYMGNPNGGGQGYFLIGPTGFRLVFDPYNGK